MIPEGTLRATGRGPGALRFSTSSNKGTQQVEVDLVVTETGPHEGAAITWVAYFSDKAWERTIEALRLLCPTWSSDDLTDLLGISERGEFGAVDAVITHEDYQGRPRARVAFVNEPGRGMGKAMASDELRTFAERMRSSVRAVPQTGSTKVAQRPAAQSAQSGPAARPATSSPPSGWDDIPPPSDVDAPNPFGRGGRR